MVVCTFLSMNCYDTEYDVLRPRTIPPFRFGGVTDWYQSIVYSELSISKPFFLYTTINSTGQKHSEKSHAFEIKSI